MWTNESRVSFYLSAFVQQLPQELVSLGFHFLTESDQELFAMKSGTASLEEKIIDSDLIIISCLRLIKI